MLVMPLGFLRLDSGRDQGLELFAAVLGEQLQMRQGIVKVARGRVDAADVEMVSQQSLANQSLHVERPRLWNSITAQPDDDATRANECSRMQQHVVAARALQQ